MISGYGSKDITVYRHNWNDMKIIFSDSDDSLIIEGFFSNPLSRNYTILVDDARFGATEQGSLFRTIIGTDDSDYMNGFDDGAFRLCGMEGYDNLNGGKFR